MFNLWTPVSKSLLLSFEWHTTKKPLCLKLLSELNTIDSVCLLIEWSAGYDFHTFCCQSDDLRLHEWRCRRRRIPSNRKNISCPSPNEFLQEKLDGVVNRCQKEPYISHICWIFLRKKGRNDVSDDAICKRRYKSLVSANLFFHLLNLKFMTRKCLFCFWNRARIFSPSVQAEKSCNTIQYNATFFI